MPLRHRWVLTIVCGLIGVLPLPVEAQQPDLPPAYLLEYSNVPMTRNAALLDTSLRLYERGIDWGLDELAGDLFARKSTGGFFARVGRSFSDLIVAGTALSVAHEYGHMMRAEENGRTGTVSIGVFSPSFFRLRGGGPLDATQRMSVFGGGMEGGYVLGERAGNRIFARGTATPGDLALLLVSSLNPEGYILGTLSEWRLASPQRLIGRSSSNILGDPVQYTLSLTAARLGRSGFGEGEITQFFDDIQATGRAIQRRSVLNFLDYEYVTTFGGLGRDYMWRGERHVPVRWLHVGALSLIPAAGYRLTPVGPELQIKSRYKLGAGVGRVYVRWTERVKPEESRLLGAGGELERLTRGRLTPKFGFDVWRNPDGTASVRGEAAATFSRSPSDRFVFSAAVGAKGRGYVAGYPVASGAFFSLGGGLRF